MTRKKPFQVFHKTRAYTRLPRKRIKKEKKREIFKMKNQLSSSQYVLYIKK